MALADGPRARVDVVHDGGALEARVDHAPPGTPPDERGIATLADVVVHGLAGGVATIRVRATDDDLHYGAIVARDGRAELLPLERRGDDFVLDLPVEAGEWVHITVVSSSAEDGMAWLRAQVEAGGMGMGGEAEMAPGAPPPPAASREPEMTPRDEASEAGPVAAGPESTDGLEGLEGLVVRGSGDHGFAPPEPVVPEGPVAASPDVDGSAPIDAHVAAQMPADLFEGVPMEVLVTLSRDEVKIAKGNAGDAQPVTFHKHRDIRIAVQARGFDVAPDATAEVIAKLPQRGRPDEYRFRLVPGEPGIGRVVVTVTQDPEVTPLATITLSTVILSADDAPPRILPAEPIQGETTAAAPPRALAELPTLAIEETISRGHAVLKITAKVGSRTAVNTLCLLDKPAFVDAIYEKLGAIRVTYKETVDSGVPAPTAVARAEESLRELGTWVASTLLGDEVNTLLWAKRRALTNLVVQTSGELDIPWEIVHLVRVGDAEHDDASHFLGEKGMTRWLWGTKRPTTLPIGEGRVVAIAPDYADENLKLESTKKEVEALEHALQETAQTAVTRDEVRELIGAGFDLLHFAGHGRWRRADPRAQEIALAAFVEAQDDGSASYRDLDAREDLRVTESAPFVFLSACDIGRLQHGTAGLGGFAEAFLLGGAGVFIGCNWAVRDDVTAEFAKTLYTELFTNNATLGDAAIAARSATRAAHDLTALAFTVFADPRARVVRA